MFQPDTHNPNESRYIELDGKQIPVTEEEAYHAYKRPLWAEHKRKETEKRCHDDNGNRCISDCSQCDKQRTGSVLSLDKLTSVGYWMRFIRMPGRFVWYRII